MILSARGNEAMRHVFAMGGRALWQKSCDAGQRWMLADVGGAPLRAWDERGHTKRASYDAARRPTHAYLQQGIAVEQLVGRTVYGEAHPSAAALNLRGKAYQVYDGAGVVTSGAYDFKGNLLHGSRRLAVDYHAVPEWSPIAGLTDVAAIVAAAEALLEAEVFTSATAYDALNRPTSTTAPDASEIRPTYNQAGLLEKIEARVRGAAPWTTFVDDIDYDAKGQREKIVYGNGTKTAYTYDPETFRLVRLKTVRPNGDAGPQNLIKDGAVLQNLAYAYDPVGNITEIKDSAQSTVFFDNAVVSPNAQYVYDALYRLTRAGGREHAGGIADVQRDQRDVALMNLPHANDAQALRNYVEQYVYDAVGNILTMSHQAGAGSWTRHYRVATTSNRLLGTSAPKDQAGEFSATYGYDAHGSMTSMPHLPSMGWDHNDQMRQVGLGGGGTAYYTYDAAGQRVRKVWEHSGLIEERIYLGVWEVYRKRDSLRNLLVERETLHGMGGTKRVVLVETKTVDVNGGGAFSVVSRFRFQLDNHLGSASLEVDESGLVIGYEEYYPYGTTAYSSGRGGVEVSGRRYRYTGKERDEETGLYYHWARHMAPWLGRWTSADPAVMVVADGIDRNAYAYVRGRVIVATDPLGLWDMTTPPTEAFRAAGRVGAAEAAASAAPEAAAAAAPEIAAAAAAAAAPEVVVAAAPEVAAAAAAAAAPRPVPGRGLGIAGGFAIAAVVLPWLYPKLTGRPFGETPEVRALRDQAESIGIYDRAASQLKPGVKVSGPVSRALADPKPQPEAASGTDPKTPPRLRPTTITLYHGTTLNGARNIVDNGVDMAVGRENLDFGRGFYTTVMTDQAWEWARGAAKKRGGLPAVVKITIKVEDLAGLSGVHFTHHTPEFEKFVREARAGVVSIAPFDYVEGPMWLNSFEPDQKMAAGGQQTAFRGAKSEDVLNRSTREILLVPGQR